MFDVQDAVVPTAGTFEVTLVKTASLNLGITINGEWHTHTHTHTPLWLFRCNTTENTTGSETLLLGLGCIGRATNMYFIV